MKGIRGFEGPANQGEGSLVQKAAIAWVKRWVRKRLEKGYKMLPDKPAGKSITVIGAVLYLASQVIGEASTAASTGDWGSLGQYFISQPFWTALSGVLVVFGMRRKMGAMLK